MQAALAAQGAGAGQQCAEDCGAAESLDRETKTFARNNRTSSWNSVQGLDYTPVRDPAVRRHCQTGRYRLRTGDSRLRIRPQQNDAPALSKCQQVSGGGPEDRRLPAALAAQLPAGAVEQKLSMPARASSSSSGPGGDLRRRCDCMDRTDCLPRPDSSALCRQCPAQPGPAGGGKVNRASTAGDPQSARRDHQSRQRRPDRRRHRHRGFHRRHRRLDQLHRADPARPGRNHQPDLGRDRRLGLQHCAIPPARMSQDSDRQAREDRQPPPTPSPPPAAQLQEVAASRRTASPCRRRASVQIAHGGADTVGRTIQSMAVPAESRSRTQPSASSGLANPRRRSATSPS